MPALALLGSASDPVTDVRRKPGAPRGLVDQRRVLHVSAGEIGLYDEGIKGPGFCGHAFATNHLRGTGGFERHSIPAIHGIDRKLPLRAKCQRKLNTRAIVRRVFERVVAHDIPGAIVAAVAWHGRARWYRELFGGTVISERRKSHIA
jgi:hypothetical protein